MSHPTAQTNHHAAHGHHEPHAPIYYIKIWGILLALLIVSIMGPMLGNKILTIFTAFGIAIVKALIVAAFFMHLNVEKKYIWYLLLTMFGAVAIFFFGVAADVMKYNGSNWTKPASYRYEEEFKKQAEASEHGEAGEGEGHISEGAQHQGSAK